MLAGYWIGKVLSNRDVFNYTIEPDRSGMGLSGKEREVDEKSIMEYVVLQFVFVVRCRSGVYI